MFTMRVHYLAAALCVALAGAAHGQNKPEAEVKPIATFTGHTAGVVGLTFTPDGKRIVSISPREIQTWDIATKKAVASSDLLGGDVATVAPGGKTAALTSTKRAGQSVDLLASADGKELFSIKPHAEVTERTAFGSLVGAMTFSPDGQRLATAGRSGLVGGPHGLPSGVVKVWDTATGKQVLHISGPRAGVSTSSFAGAVAFSADGKFLAAGTDGAGGELPESGAVVVWSATDGKVVRAIEVQAKVEPGDFHSSVTTVAISPDGNLVAAAYGNRPARADGLILSDEPIVALQVWEVKTGHVVQTLRGHTAAIGQIAFSPDGRRLASAVDDRTVRWWDTTTGAQVQSVSQKAGPIRALGFRPDGKHLAAGGSDRELGVVWLWACPGE